MVRPEIEWEPDHPKALKFPVHCQSKPTLVRLGVGKRDFGPSCSTKLLLIGHFPLRDLVGLSADTHQLAPPRLETLT